MRMGDFAKVHGAGAGALALLTAVVYFGAVEPVLSDKVARLALEERTSVEEKRTSDLGSQISNRSRELEQVTREIQKAKVKLEPASNLPSRMGALAELARRMGVGIADVEPGPARPGNRYGVVPIALRGEGSYLNCTAFLEQLTRQFKDVGVRSLKLSGNGVRPGGGLRFKVDLAWYVSPPEKFN